MTAVIPLGYAQVSLTFHKIGSWVVTAAPYGKVTGMAVKHNAGWTAETKTGQVLGLFPDKRAAGEALVRHAGYEVLR